MRTLRAPLTLLPLLLLGCSAEITTDAVDHADEQCDPPSRTTSREALQLARRCVPAVADAAVVEFASDYHALDEGTSAGRFPSWDFVFFLNGDYTYVYVGQDPADRANGLIVDETLSFEQQARPSCSGTGLPVADSTPRAASALAVFHDPPPTKMIRMFHSAPCIPWRQLPNFAVTFPQDQCGDCYQYITFDEEGSVVRTCWSHACRAGDTQFCCDD
jgi:hypothetical protein